MYLDLLNIPHGPEKPNTKSAPNSTLATTNRTESQSTAKNPDQTTPSVEVKNENEKEPTKQEEENSSTEKESNKTSKEKTTNQSSVYSKTNPFFYRIVTYPFFFHLQVRAQLYTILQSIE